jgi:hypothetical protein
MKNAWTDVEVVDANGREVCCDIGGQHVWVSRALLDADSDTWDIGDYGRLVIKSNPGGESYGRQH